MKYLWYAFRHKWNLVFLTAGAVAGLFFSISLPLFYPLLFVAETLILLAATSNGRFRRLVDSLESKEKEKEEIRRLRNAVYGTNSALKSRLAPVEELIRQIRHNTRQNRKITAEAAETMLSELDALYGNFIRLLHSYCKLDEMRQSAFDQADEVARLQTELAKLPPNAPPEAKAALERRIEIAQKRVTLYREAEKSKTKLLAQMDMLEETLLYIRDLSLQAFEPAALEKEATAISERMQTTHETLIEVERATAQAMQGLEKLRAG